MGTAEDVLSSILAERDLRLINAKDRTARANIIAEDYGICWLIAFALANNELVLKALKEWRR
jgi:hypothetical protein